MGWRDRAAPAGHCHSNGVGWDDGVGQPPHGTPWGPRWQHLGHAGDVAARFQQQRAWHTGGSARLNAARQVCAGARPVPLDFWRGWSQPRRPAGSCGLRARRQVTAPAHGAGTACRDCSVPSASSLLPGNRERAAPSLLWASCSLGVHALGRWRRAGDQEDTWRCQWSCRGAFGWKRKCWASVGAVGCQVLRKQCWNNPALGMEAGREQSW